MEIIMKKNRSFLASAPCLWLIILAIACADASIGQAIDVELSSLRSTVLSVTRQMIMQQFAAEERIRSEGDSGIKRVRMMDRGTRPYDSESFSRRTVCAIHDHSNAERTVGMGEFIAVQNGNEFRTRHNDYLLRMPSRTSPDYHATEDIEFPPVPPEVTSKPSVREQIKEMTQWFAAFKNQNYTDRDYRMYFKPILCYLEGTWTIPNQDLEEPFPSERHQLDAPSFHALQDKIRFTSYTGSKSNFENLAYLPTKIMGIRNNTTPQFAQWNYRILCNPLKDDIPLNRFGAVDDLGTRMSIGKSISAFELSRSARFQLGRDGNVPFEHGTFSYGHLDMLMRQIPGKENHGGNITDNGLDLVANDYAIPKRNVPLNAAFYHRIFKAGRRGAMGTSKVNRGFSDRNLFVAYTEQPKVAAMTAEQCRRGKCKAYTQRVSYAIPLEIIYLNPLQRWNPYNIPHRGSASNVEGKAVTANSRNGGSALNKAFNGTNSRVYYRTPAEFFTDGTVSRDSADTTKSITNVLDSRGRVRQVSASGVRIFMPRIPGVGMIRQRYPIMPIHDEGHNIHKKLAALEDIVLNLPANMHMIRDPPDFYSINIPHNALVKLETDPATSDPPGNHTHIVNLSTADLASLIREETIKKFTTESAGHVHVLDIEILSKRYHIKQCDGSGRSSCGHNHGSYLTMIEP